MGFFQALACFWVWKVHTSPSVTYGPLILVFLHGLAIAQVVLPAVSTGADRAYVDCPCVSNSSASPQVYGMGSCTPWDADGASRPFAEECGQPQPAAWCTSLWCYVDPKNCSRTHHPSVFGQLVFSYTTCGNIDPWVLSQHVTVNTILPQKVLVAVPKVGYYVSKTNPETVTSMRLTMEFAYFAFQEMGMLQNIKYRNISDSSLQMSSSRYTSCAHDVAIGNVDVCLGDAWETPERLGFGVAFLEVYTEDVYLVTLSAEPKVESVWDTLTKPFSPFSWDLWALLIGTYILAAALFACLEHREHEMFEDHHIHESLFRSIYEVSMSFLGGGLTYEANTVSGRLLLFGIGFFIMISVASFTASTATSLIIHADVEPAIRDLHDALSKGQRICYPPGLARAILRKFPALQEFGVVTDSGSEYLLAGKCDSSVLAEPIFTDSQAAGEMCGYTMVGKPVMSFSVGFYVADSLRPRLAVASTKLKLDGTWDDLERELLKESACSTSSKEENDENYQLTSQHMLGTCFLLVICGTFAVVVKCFDSGISSLFRSTHSLPVARTDEKSMPNSDLPDSMKDAPEPTLQDLMNLVVELQMTLQNKQICPMEPTESNKASASTCLYPGPPVIDDLVILQKLQADDQEIKTSKDLQDERTKAPDEDGVLLAKSLKSPNLNDGTSQEALDAGNLISFRGETRREDTLDTRYWV